MNLTQAQIDATKERRERFRGFVRTISKMSDEERTALADRLPGLATCEGHVLSPYNQVLIALQTNGQPVTILGGFRQWKRQGRHVRKGEHGFVVWIPCLPKKENEQDKDQPTDETEEVKFILGTLFDISQTEESLAT